MTGEQVVRILDETVDWYRILGAQQQSTNQPSDLLILYANRQIADKAIALAVQIARAKAELLSSEARCSWRFSATGVEALVRYPVQLQRAAEIDERISRELLKVMTDAAA